MIRRLAAAGYRGVPGALLALALGLAAPALAGGFHGDGPIRVDSQGVAVKGYDLVAYFREGRPRRGLPEFEHRFSGARFRFASAAHRDLFAQEPEKYLPAFGGYCALGVANGYKDDMDPHAFEIVEGRLYFNLTPRIHAGWSRHKQRLIPRAERNWPALRDAPGYGPRDAR